MSQAWEHIQEELCCVLEKDKKIRPDAFDEALTAQKFADLIFSLVLSALLRQNYNSSSILEIIKRTIY